MGATVFKISEKTVAAIHSVDYVIFFVRIQLFQDFLRTSSKLDSYNPVTKTGQWRQVTVRTNQKKQIMAIGVINSADLKQVSHIQNTPQVRTGQVRSWQ